MGTYAPPIIGPSGLQIPDYQAILAYLIGQYRGIYGQSVYLAPDAADYQDLAIRALQVADLNSALQQVVLSFNPQTATGVALDTLGRLIGTARKVATFSTALVTLTGTAGTVVSNGVVRDQNGNFWNLPSVVTIGGGGTVNATATAQLAGATTANPNTINIISNPTFGWTAVTNADAAVPGNPVEPDSAYRARLLISQAKPSLTRLQGTVGAVAEVSGVTRSVVYENSGNFTASFGTCDTSGVSVTVHFAYPLDTTCNGSPITINGVVYTIDTVTGPDTLTLTSSAGTQSGVLFWINQSGVSSSLVLGPAHSITTVVEGGAAADIAQAIYNNRGIGCYTNGTTSVSVADPLNPAVILPMRFSYLGYVPVYVSVSLKALEGYTSATAAAIVTGVSDYLNSLGIGETVVYSELYGAVLTARPNPDQPLFSIRSLQSGAAVAETNATLVNGNPDIVVASAAGIVIGQTVTGSNIPGGTTVSNVVGTTVTMSANATANASGVPVQFFDLGTSDILVPYNEAAQGSAQNVLVTTI